MFLRIFICPNVAIVQNPPYTMLVESHEKLSGNARFEGFAIDLARELSHVLGFNFTFKLVDDEKVVSLNSLCLSFEKYYPYSMEVKYPSVTGMVCLAR